MQNYVGTKQMLARPMTRQEYNDYRGWALPEAETGSDEGMLVEYVDGGKANDPRHAGYISWSPKDVFDRAYKQYDDDFIGRMRQEHAELKEKAEKLSGFLHSDVFKGLDAGRKSLLTAQKLHMQDYLDVLGRRIVLETGEGQA